MDVNILDLSAYVGLTAVGAATLNIFLGTLMAFRYSPLRSWPHRKLNYFRLHNWCGYIALSASLLHPLILLFNPTPKFSLTAIAYPLHSPGQAGRKHLRRTCALSDRHRRHYFLLQDPARSPALESFPFLHLFRGRCPLLS